MRTVFSTADVHPRDAYDYFHEVLCKKVIAHDCRPASRQGFHSVLQSVAMTDIALVRYENSPMHNRVTARHASQANGDELLVRLQIAGRFVFEQDNGESLLEPGDMTLLDPRRPMQGTYLEGANQLVLKAPRRELKARLGDIRPMIGLSIKPLATEQRLTSSLLEILPTYIDELDATARDAVRNLMLDLVAISLAKVVDADQPRISSPRSLAFMRLRAAIDAGLANPSLDAETVAAAAGISVRYANDILADQDTSIMRMVWARRLERCRKALEDPSQAHRTVSDIAYAWGFSDMTHFGRRFRAAYGKLPSDYRRRARVH